MNNIDDLLFRRAIIYIILFVFVFLWNWVNGKASGRIDEESLLDVVGLTGFIMESFDFHNTTCVSAKDQDRRWMAYKEYFRKYQHRLRHSHFEYYVVYTTTNSGLANKMNGLISSLLVAMVTNRGLLRSHLCFLVTL